MAIEKREKQKESKMRWFLKTLSLMGIFSLAACSDSSGTSPIDPGDYTLTLKCGEEEVELPITLHVDWDSVFDPITIEQADGGSEISGKFLRNDEGKYEADSRIDLFFFGDVEGSDVHSALFRFGGDCAPSGEDYECEGSCFGAVVKDDEGEKVEVEDAKAVFVPR